ncbi:hypothetical protein POM88_017424 [Heracleum sosnowskyi]|uniref:Uncharacterized protein n=1 Tax=Heracleum sosnowskyi TaxID=360622 RepID=A0AAD8IQT9_9APIA|nr:hypothetical protein POM88_017424 [Heracleum sosnowskyi]
MDSLQFLVNYSFQVFYLLEVQTKTNKIEKGVRLGWFEETGIASTLKLLYETSHPKFGKVETVVILGWRSLNEFACWLAGVFYKCRSLSFHGEDSGLNGQNVILGELSIFSPLPCGSGDGGTTNRRRNEDWLVPKSSVFYNCLSLSPPCSRFCPLPCGSGDGGTTNRRRNEDWLVPKSSVFYNCLSLSPPCSRFCWLAGVFYKCRSLSFHGEDSGLNGQNVILGELSIFSPLPCGSGDGGTTNRRRNEDWLVPKSSVFYNCLSLSPPCSRFCWLAGVFYKCRSLSFHGEDSGLNGQNVILGELSIFSPLPCGSGDGGTTNRRRNEDWLVPKSRYRD